MIGLREKCTGKLPFGDSVHFLVTKKKGHVKESIVDSMYEEEYYMFVFKN